MLGAWSPFPRSGEDLGAVWGWGSAGEREACAGLVWKFCWRSRVRKRRLRATLRRTGDWDTRRRKPRCPPPRPSLLLHATGGVWLIRGAEPRSPGRGKIPGGPLLPACLPDAALQARPGPAHPASALDQEPGPEAALSAGPRGSRREAGLRPSRVGRIRSGLEEVGRRLEELRRSSRQQCPGLGRQPVTRRLPLAALQAAPQRLPLRYPKAAEVKPPRRGHCNQLPPVSI